MPDRPSTARQARFGLSLLLGLLATSPHLLQAAEESTIPWLTNFDQAASLSREQGRPLWVQFQGPWCPYCRQMEATTFVSMPVIRLARERFVCVSIRSDLRPDLVSRFRVTGLPTALVLAPDGRILARREGYADPLTFATVLQGAADRCPVAASGPAVEEVALGGYCPVNLVRTGTLKPGLLGLSERYDGRVYRFLDAESREAFRKEPERYLPGVGGHCIVHLVDVEEAVPGDPRFGVYYKRRLYLCADASSREQFARDPEHYIGAVLSGEDGRPRSRSVAGRLAEGNRHLR